VRTSKFVIRPKKRRKVRRQKRPSPSLPPPIPKSYEEAKDLYNTREYKSWRIAVLRRDRRTCQLCGQQGGQLEVHHIRPKYLFPELTLVIENGCTLCKYCHQKIVTRKESKFYFIFDRIVKANNRRKEE
jgi:5-methylcytosine-specific restriction endonuclease McrA